MKNNIGTGAHYLSITEHPFYKRNFGWKNNDFPFAYKIGRETVSIPLSAKLNIDEVYYIIKTIKNIFTKC